MDCPKRNSLAGLPDEAMLEILARSPFRSVCRSKCVAKAWRDLIDDPLNRRRLPQTLQGFFSISLSTPMGDNLEHCFVKYSASSVPLDIDPSFSFLPETENLYLLDSCNGLLLFKQCSKSNEWDVLSYVVCNPATKHWGIVPVCVSCPPPKAQAMPLTYLIFDPARAVTPHFYLIQFWKPGFDGERPLFADEIDMLELSVHTYSSESGVWSHNQTDWNEQGHLEGWRRWGSLYYGGLDQRTFVNGLLHLMVWDQDGYQIQIVAVDVQGKTKRIITRPDAAEGMRWYNSPCISQSQGHLHYIDQIYYPHDSPHDSMLPFNSEELSIWVLQDYDTQEWVLKDTVTFERLFGRTEPFREEFDIVAIHPDCSVVFFCHSRLIAYDMDRKEVIVFLSAENLRGEIVPYIPYFSESLALTNKD